MSRRYKKLMKPKLIIHIGHGKTGTSFIQSVLSLNIENLRNNGVIYPDHPSFMSARNGNISSGNGDLIMNRLFEIDSNISTLLSNESLFHYLAVDNNLARLVLSRDCNLEIICYTRNVVEMICSTWGQMIKRGGYTKSIEEYITENRDPHYPRILWWLNAAENFEFKIKIRNYSNHKSNIDEIFLYDVFDGTSVNFLINKPKNVVINRSLTLAEYEIQRVCNEFSSKSSSFISDVLVNSLPLIKAEKPFISMDTYDFLVDRMSLIIERINNRIPRDESILIEPMDTTILNTSKELYTLSKEQIAVLFKSILNQIPRR